MNIYINDWSRAGQLRATRFCDNMEIEGGHEDVTQIVNELFQAGLDVQVTRFKLDPEWAAKNKIPDLNAIRISVDKNQFKTTYTTHY